MASFWIITNSDLLSFFTAPTTVTCAGTVKAPHGAALRRRIYIYRDQDHQSSYVATTVSDPITGTFSVQVPGHAASEFTVICKGDIGENDSIVANCNLNGTGPTGLYIAPPLNNIPFIIGPGEVTSPYVDIVFPMPVVDAEGQVDIVAWGDTPVTLPVVEAEGATTIIAWGDVNFGFAQAEGVADVYYETDANPQIPTWQVNAEASTSIYAWGDVRLPVLQVRGVFAAHGVVSFPVPVVESLVLNPIVCHGDVRLPSAVVNANGESGRVSWGAARMPVLSVDGYAVRHDVHQGSVDIPSWAVAGIAHVEDVSVGQVDFPAAQVSGVAEQTHVFAPVSFTPDCGVEIT